MDECCPYETDYLTKNKSKLKKLKEQLSLLNACNPTRKQVAKKRLYDKLIKKEEAKINKELRLNDLPPLMW